MVDFTAQPVSGTAPLTVTFTNRSQHASSYDWAFGDGDALYLVGHDTLGQCADGAWTYYLPDALGSVRQATDGAGAVVSAREWSP